MAKERTAGRKQAPRVSSAPRASQEVRALVQATKQLRLALAELRAPRAPAVNQVYLGDLWAWWSKEYLPRRLDKRTLRQWWTDYLAPPFGLVTVAELTPAAIDQVLANLDGRLAPRTVNGVRGLLSKVICDAAANGRWERGNPVTATRARRVPGTRWPTLTVEEARALLATARPPFRLLCALSIYLSLRKGESFALRVGDVDLAQRTVDVRRSHERNTTKNGRARLLPIVDELVPLLEEHLAQVAAAGEAHPLGPLLFQNTTGGLLRRDDKTSRKLRAALRAAKVVTGWTAICRRCGTRSPTQDASPRCCSLCGMAIWFVAVPKKLRFYDLRHTFASLARDAGIAQEARSMMLGHVPDSSGRYDQWSMSHLREELSKMRITVAEKIEAPTAPTVEASAATATPFDGKGEEAERERRFELPTRSLGSCAMQERTERARVERFEKAADDVELQLADVERHEARALGRKQSRLTPTEQDRLARLQVSIAHKGARCPCGAKGAFRVETVDGLVADYCEQCSGRVLRKFKKDGGR